MWTHYVAIDNRDKPEALQVIDGTPEGGPGASPSVLQWGEIPGVGYEGFGWKFLEAVSYLLRFRVDRAVVALEPYEPHSRLYLSVAKAEGGFKARLHQFIFLSKQ